MLQDRFYYCRIIYKILAMGYAIYAKAMLGHQWDGKQAMLLYAMQ